MAKKKKQAADKPKVNKSEAIRSYKAKNKNAMPKDIAEALAAKGIAVSAAMVSTTLSNARRKSGKTGGRGRGRAAASTGDIGIDQIKSAASFIRNVGSIEDAEAALKAAKAVAHALQ